MFDTATRIVAAAAVAAAVAAAAPAGAAGFGEPLSVEVRHGDLDLATAQDVARLNRRIIYAAKAVCGQYDARDLQAAPAVKACRAEAIAAAAPKVELAIAQARGGSKLAGSIGVHAVSVP